MKNVLILCTGNSCRSIMGEALCNHYFKDLGIKAYSSGTAPTKEVNKGALEALKKEGIETNYLSSKTIDELPIKDFDLVVTVCDHAKETCPMFIGKTKIMHVGFKDPTGGDESDYMDTLIQIRETLLPQIKDGLAG